MLTSKVLRQLIQTQMNCCNFCANSETLFILVANMQNTFMINFLENICVDIFCAFYMPSISLKRQNDKLLIAIPKLFCEVYTGNKICNSRSKTHVNSCTIEKSILKSGLHCFWGCTPVITKYWLTILSPEQKTKRTFEF